MKYWQVVKELEGNPGKVFEGWLDEKGDWKVRMRVVRGISRYFHFEVFNGERVIDQSLGGGGFNGNVATDLDWHEVRQPVTWQEAIQAWVDGNTVVWERDADGDRSTFRAYVDELRAMENEHGVPIRLKHLNSGKWYVED